MIEILDTHTGGEPTRVVISGFPELPGTSIAEKRDSFRSDFDKYRSAVVNEPRGSDVMVGALLLPPVNAGSVAGVIFFNNVGYLGMCGHGTIGVAVALAHLGKIGGGIHRLDTPVGVVEFELLDSNRVRLTNVPSYRYKKDVGVEVPDWGSVVGDISWGGNWFYLVSSHQPQLDVSQWRELTAFTEAIRRALIESGITGSDGGEIDHVELFGPPGNQENDSRNFVLCPGSAYDRSPCGTGTSAKLSILAANGKLLPGETWLQESIIGSLFEGRYQIASDIQVPGIEAPVITPEIIGSAYVCGKSILYFDPQDPFCWGIRS